MAVDSDLCALTLAQAHAHLRQKKCSAVELTQAFLTAIDAAHPLNAFVHVTAESALEQARQADATLSQSGESAPVLCGMPLAIKDLFCTKDAPAQAGSKILDGFRPPYESFITQNLWHNGAVMLGKVNMDEFAMGSSGETSVYGAAVNPWRMQGNSAPLTPGGSSSGSAAAVAADLCLAALGTDTGGSIRQPAAFTGIVGLKPTYGRCSRWGIIAFASSLDQAGPMTKSVRDAAILLHTMAGHDARDSTSRDCAVPDFQAMLRQSIKGKKIGIAKQHQQHTVPISIQNLWDQGIAMLRAQGAEIIDISLPHIDYSLAVYYIIATAEASSNLARYDGVRYGYRAAIGADEGIVDMYEKTRSAGFGAEVKRRIMIGTYVLSSELYDAYYRHAQKVRTLIKNDFTSVFADGIDAILTPSTPFSAFAMGTVGNTDPTQMYLNDLFTVPVNLAGLPAVSVPVGLDDQGLPLALQLIGRPWQEADMLNLAYALEQAAAFQAKPQRWW